MKLAIGANASEGYRTYSRQTIDARRKGQWRVELRSPDDGVVLAAERFSVQ